MTSIQAHYNLNLTLKAKLGETYHKVAGAMMRLSK